MTYLVKDETWIGVFWKTSLNGFYVRDAWSRWYEGCGEACRDKRFADVCVCSPHGDGWSGSLERGEINTGRAERPCRAPWTVSWRSYNDPSEEASELSRHVCWCWVGYVVIERRKMWWLRLTTKPVEARRPSSAYKCIMMLCIMMHDAWCMMHDACMDGGGVETVSVTISLSLSQHTYIHTYMHAYIHACMHAHI